MKVQYQLVDVETKKAIKIGDEFKIVMADFGKEERMSWTVAAMLFGDPFAEPPAGIIYGTSPIEAARKNMEAISPDVIFRPFVGADLPLAIHKRLSP